MSSIISSAASNSERVRNRTLAPAAPHAAPVLNLAASHSCCRVTCRRPDNNRVTAFSIASSSPGASFSSVVGNCEAAASPSSPFAPPSSLPVLLSSLLDPERALELPSFLVFLPVLPFPSFLPVLPMNVPPVALLTAPFTLARVFPSPNVPPVTLLNAACVFPSPNVPRVAFDRALFAFTLVFVFFSFVGFVFFAFFDAIASSLLIPAVGRNVSSRLR